MKSIRKIITISIIAVLTTGCAANGSKSSGFLDALTAVSPILSLVPGGSNITSAILAAKSVSNLVNSGANPISTLASVAGMAGVPGVSQAMNDPAIRALTAGVQTVENISRMQTTSKQQNFLPSGTVKNQFSYKLICFNAKDSLCGEYSFSSASQLQEWESACTRKGGRIESSCLTTAQNCYQTTSSSDLRAHYYGTDTSLFRSSCTGESNGVLF